LLENRFGLLLFTILQNIFHFWTLMNRIEALARLLIIAYQKRQLIENRAVVNVIERFLFVF